MALIDQNIIEVARQMQRMDNIRSDGWLEYCHDYKRIIEDTNFDAWAEGTEFGATFLDKLNKLQDIMGDFKNSESELDNKLKSFLARQNEINKNGV
jgi:hypothetical protein